jgi:hypothetical protein
MLTLRHFITIGCCALPSDSYCFSLSFAAAITLIIIVYAFSLLICRFSFSAIAAAGCQSLSPPLADAAAISPPSSLSRYFLRHTPGCPITPLFSLLLFR